MIRSFKCKETEKLFKNKNSMKFPPDIIKRARNKLILLNSAYKLIDLMAPPANKLEQLQGNRAGQHSIRINDQWRICFVWNDGIIENVEIVDYH
ncbi:MAG: type II toxin-antitoxin system RelE/ParE family toxin [Candidatus Riflebacteria bacterium]|nr:type II toxin-antitoxin system RelE/ParE family toxin [Candidatus Riflebacteria bacterium]